MPTRGLLGALCGSFKRWKDREQEEWD